MATAEIDKYSEAAKQLNKEIDGLKAEKSDLQVRIVKLNTAPPKVPLWVLPLFLPAALEVVKLGRLSAVRPLVVTWAAR